MNPTANGDGWKLEVVRGTDAGRLFALGIGEFVLGNAPGDRNGIDLATQEAAASLKRMEARHAALDCSPAGLAVRDLVSPGGTFVNRQRVLPGQTRSLQAGDVIQLGGVQLKVVHGQAAAAPPPSAPAKPGSFAYAIPGGPTCRSWDDILVASAQRWEALRGELSSGRLAAFLVSAGQGELAPSPRGPGSADERLDAWLGSLPTTKPGRPELEIHPARLVIRATPGGGTIRRSVQVSNVGFRLLRSTARIEPVGVPWLALAPEFAGKPFVTIEGTDLVLEVAIPETLPRPLTAELVVEGNGGSKRIAVILEAKPAAAEFAEGSASVESTSPSGVTFAELIARQSPLARVATWGLIALAIRMVIGVVSGSIGEDAMVASGAESPRLAGVAVALAGVGGVLGGLLAARRGGSREIPTGAFAGGCAGVILAAALVATCRSVEPVLGSWSTSVIAVCVLWSLIGSGLAGLSTLVVKGKS